MLTHQPTMLLFVLVTFMLVSSAEQVHSKTTLPKDDIVKLSKLKDHSPVTEADLNEFLTKKDCSSYKPSKRIQCDISLYNAGLTTKIETISDIKVALMEWEKELGTADSFFFIGLDTVNWALAIGHADLILGTTYATLTMMLPRYHKKEYIHHHTMSTKPTIVYSYNEINGNEVLDHWNTWTAIEGDANKNILYVANKKATSKSAESGENDCKGFMELSKSVKERKHVTVVVDGPRCTKIPTSHRVLVGHYKKIEQKGLHTTTVWVPIWECDPSNLQCTGDMTDEEIAWAQTFLA